LTQNTSLINFVQQKEEEKTRKRHIIIHTHL